MGGSGRQRWLMVAYRLGVNCCADIRLYGKWEVGGTNN